MSRLLKRSSVLALLLTLAVLGACHRAPRRAGPTLERISPPPNLQVNLADELGTAWVIHYLQVYVDGWLLWEGVPERRSRQVGTFVVERAGEQEVYVRVLGTRRGMVGGELATNRKVLMIGAGTTRIQIRLSGGALLDPRDIDVDINEL
jgi:hypothetical protein